MHHPIRICTMVSAMLRWSLNPTYFASRTQYLNTPTRDTFSIESSVIGSNKVSTTETTLTIPEAPSMPKLSDITTKFWTDLLAGVLGNSKGSQGEPNEISGGNDGRGWRY